MANWLTRTFSGRAEQATPAAQPVEERIGPSVSDSWGTHNSWTMPSVFASTSEPWDPHAEGLEHVSASALAARCLEVQTGMLAGRTLAVVDSDGADVAGAQPIRDLFNFDWRNGLSARTNRAILWGRMLAHGQALVLLDRGISGVGTVTGMTVAMGRFEPVISEPTILRPYGEITGWKVWDSRGQSHGYRASEVLWLRFPDPSTQWGVISPLTAALTDIALQHAARVWQRAQFKGGSAQVAIDLPGAPPEVVAAVRQEVQALASGAENAGRAIVAASGATGPGMKVHPLGMSAQDLAWLDGMGLTNEQILHAFNMPRDLFIGGSTYENQRTAGRSLWTQNLNPRLAIVASEIDRVFYPTPDLTAAFPTDDVEELQADADRAATRRKTDADALRALTVTDVLTVDEAREREGLPPLPDGRGAVTLTEYRARFQPQPVSDEARAMSSKSMGFAGEKPAIPGPADGANPLVRTPETRPGASVCLRVSVGGSESAAEIERHVKAAQRVIERLGKEQAERVKNLLKRKAKRGAHIRIDEQEPLSGLWFEKEQDEIAEKALASASEPSFYASSTATAATLADAGFDVAAAFKVGDVPAQVLEALADLVTETAPLINATSRDDLYAAMAEGAKNGEGGDALAARVDEVFGWKTSGRAEVIARDLNLAAYHMGQHLAIETSSLGDSKVTKRWQAAGDDRVRASHAALDGAEVKGLQGRFSNGALYPGDRAAGASESIQCRCTVEYDFDPEDDE